MFEDIKSGSVRSPTFPQDQRFSFANDHGAYNPAVLREQFAPHWFGKRLAGASLAFLLLAGAGGLIEASIPGNARFEARVLAVIPDDENGVKTPMSDVVRYVSALFSSSEVRQAARSEFGSDIVDTVSVSSEERAPVVLISADESDAALARAAVDYFAERLAAVKVDDDGAEDTRRALELTWQDAQTELQAFEAGNPATDNADGIDSSLVDIAALKRAVEAARERTEAAEKLNLKAVLDGRVDDDLVTPALTALTLQYTQASAELGALSEKLGPRHPQYLAAKSAMAAAGQKIRREINLIVKEARAEAQSAAGALLKAEKQHAKTRGRVSAADTELQRLQAAVSAAKANLDAFNAEQLTLPPARFRMISPASRVEEPLFEPGLISLAGLAAGALAGLVLFVVGGRRSAARSEYLQHEGYRPAMPVGLPAKAEPGILQQFDALEKAWPSTGRWDAMPEAANDEAEQQFEPEVRALARRLAELRQRAERAAYAGSEPSLEAALADMRRLRRKVGNLAEARQKRTY